MLYYLTTREHAYTVSHFIDFCGPEFASRVRPVPYCHLGKVPAVRPGVFIFADLERVVCPAQRDAIAHVWDRLDQSGRARLFNHPRRALCRLPLLQRFFDLGLNPYNARQVSDASRALRPPTFLRNADDHHGPRTQFLDDPAQARTAGFVLLMHHPVARAIIEVEYFHTAAADGLFRKYAAYLLDGKIIPRHLMASREWSVKTNDVDAPQLAEEQRRYLETNPHAGQLLPIFKAAGIDYGRIDYSIHNGRVVTWEVNTNPNLMRQLKYYSPRSIEEHRPLWAQLRGHFEALEATAPTGDLIPLEWDRLRLTGSARGGTA